MASARQLVAIMFTDIVGYTALMGQDEQKAFDVLYKNRQIQQPLIKQFNGKWIKELGDGVLASFTTATDAVLCACAIQRACIRVPGLQLRIGIHQGEVVFEKSDVFGDGVNLASRIQAMAPVGGILVSDAVYANIRNKQGVVAEFFGEQTLKNVTLPVRLYIIEAGNETIQGQEKISKQGVLDTKEKQIRLKKVLPLLLGLMILMAIAYFLFYTGYKDGNVALRETKAINKSIAVLPFATMSNDSSQAYFAQGMVDEILNHLFKIGGLNVISRTSSMSFKDSKKTSKEIAKELGVANLLEGSVQKSGDRIRIIVQLIDGTTDEHLWSENYDRDFKDVFTVQSEIAQEVAMALKVKIDPDTRQRLEHVPTTNTSAYNLYLLSKDKYLRGDLEGWKEQLEEVVKLDPNFAPAYADLGLYWLNNDDNIKQVLDSAPPLLEKAMLLDSNLSSVHSYLAYFHYWYEWDFEAAEKEWEKFFQLNRSGFWWIDYVDFLIAGGKAAKALEFALKEYERDRKDVNNWVSLAFAYYYAGHAAKAVTVMDSARLLFDVPHIYFMKARIFVHLGEYQKVIDNLSKLFVMNPGSRDIPRLQAWLAIAYYQLGNSTEAEKLLEQLKIVGKTSQAGSPAFHVSLIYAQTGRTELALQWLETAYSNHEVEMHWLGADRLFNPLRSSKRFQTIVDKIKQAK